MPRIGFTEHAIDRFVERHAPELSREEARNFLAEAAQSAVKLRQKTYSGQFQWQVEDSGIILVTKRDAGEDVCVTVLPQPEQHGISEEEMELMREYALVQPSVPPPAPQRNKQGFFGTKKAPVAAEGSQQIFTLSKKQVRQLLHVRHLEVAKVRQVEKTKRHFDKQAEEISKTKRALRVAIRFLLNNAWDQPDAAKQAIIDIRAIDPGFLSEGFWNPEWDPAKPR